MFKLPTIPKQKWINLDTLYDEMKTVYEMSREYNSNFYELEVSEGTMFCYKTRRRYKIVFESPELVAVLRIARVSEDLWFEFAAGPSYGAMKKFLATEKHQIGEAEIEKAFENNEDLYELFLEIIGRYITS